MDCCDLKALLKKQTMELDNFGSRQRLKAVIRRELVYLSWLVYLLCFVCNYCAVRDIFSINVVYVILIYLSI